MLLCKKLGKGCSECLLQICYRVLNDAYMGSLLMMVDDRCRCT